MLWLLLSCTAAFPMGSPQQEDEAPLDLKSIPISDWLNAGERVEIPWELHVSEPYLRVDQRIEVSYTASFRGRDLNQITDAHELFFISRVSSLDGEWLEEPSVSRPVEQAFSAHGQTQFFMRVCLKPGDYQLWVVLYNRYNEKHNLAKRRIHVSEFRRDPLPDMYQSIPLVEFPDAGSSDQAFGFVKGRLYLPVHNKHPLDVRVIATLSPPEQWISKPRVLRTQNDVTLGAVGALSELALSEGTLAIAGLDLVRQEVSYDKTDIHGVEWPMFEAALKKAQTPSVSAKDLQGSKNNGAFFRDFLGKHIDPGSGENPMRILIIVSSSQLFERGSDLTPLQVEGDCRCKVYHLRFRLNNSDVFDEISKIIRSLHPRTFDLGNAHDMRNAIAEIISDLERF